MRVCFHCFLLQLCAMRSSSLLLLSFLVGVCDVEGSSEFRICAFNLQHYGDSKSKKSNVMQILTKVRQRQMDLAETLTSVLNISGQMFSFIPL